MMATVNGVLTPPTRPDSANDSINLSAKRKRDESTEAHNGTNGTNDSKTHEQTVASIEDSQALVQDLIDVLKEYDTRPSVLSLSLPTRATSTEPQAKRQKAEDASETQSSILSRTSAKTYKDLDDVLKDIDIAVSEINEKFQLPNGIAQGHNLPFSAPNFEASAKVLAFKKRAHELVKREKASSGQSIKSDQNDESKFTINGSLGSDAFTQVNAGADENKMVLTLYGTAQQPKQMFSSFQLLTIVNENHKDIIQPLRQTSLPGGISATQIIPMQSSNLVESNKRITLGEVFPTNIPEQSPPRPSKFSTTRSLTVGWYHPSEADTYPRLSTYSKQSIYAGQWLDYSKASAPQNTKRKQRDRAMSLGGTKAPQIGADPAESEAAKLDALFRGAYSGFAPTKDDAAAIAPSGLVARMWYQRMGEKSFERSVENENQLVKVINPESDVENAIDDEEMKQFEELVEKWEEEPVAMSLPLEANVQKSAEEKDVDEILEGISELLETLNSYQRIRHLTLPTSRPAGHLSAPDTSSLGTPTKPSEPEQATYEILKSQLSLTIATLPPYAVAKLDADRLADLGISSKIEVQLNNYRGVMEEDETAIRARAAAASVSSARAPQPSLQHRNSSSALYGNQYAAPRPAAPNAQYYNVAQTPNRLPHNNLQRPPSSAPAPFPAQRPAAAAPYRTAAYGTPNYPHQTPRPTQQQQYAPANPASYLQTPNQQPYMRPVGHNYQNVPQTASQAPMNGRFPPQASYPHQTPHQQNGYGFREGPPPGSPSLNSPPKPAYNPQATPGHRPSSYSTPTPSMTPNYQAYRQNGMHNGSTPQAGQGQSASYQPTLTGYKSHLSQEEQSNLLERQKLQLAQTQAQNLIQQQARNAAQPGLGSPSKAQINGNNAVTAGL